MVQENVRYHKSRFHVYELNIDEYRENALFLSRDTSDPLLATEPIVIFFGFSTSSGSRPGHQVDRHSTPSYFILTAQLLPGP